MLALIVWLSGCTSEPLHFDIASGSENQTLEPLVQEFARKNRAVVRMHFQGSVDMMLALQQGTIPADAVWPASSIWLHLGDRRRLTKHGKSIMVSPVVFGIRRGKARELGFVDRDVRVADLLRVVEEGRLSFAMTSASQSNSGASAYLGFLYALSGSPEVLTRERLQDPELRPRIKKLLSGINRSAGSSGWLKDLFLKGGYDALVNYEALLIEANQELVRRGQEPLYVVYPQDGLVLADSPLAYVNRGDPRKEAFFKKLQAYLLEPKVQQELINRGRRAAFGGTYPPAIWQEAWGLRPGKIPSPIKLPSAEVIYEALELYQTLFRKPSNTVYALDFSGSMKDSGAAQLKEAMGLILDPARSSPYLLQPAPADRITVIPFNDRIIGVWKVQARDEGGLRSLIARIEALEPNRGTDIYTALARALALVCHPEADRYFTAVVLMTDGKSNSGPGLPHLEQALSACGRDIPIFSIQFGEAERRQLDDVSEFTRGRVFDGRRDLIGAFRDVRGYNQ